MKKIGFLLSNACLPFLSVVIFFSSCSKNDMDFDYGQVEDIDGNTYKTIQIGQQVWMAENLKTTTYRDGTPIPYGHLESGTTEAENEEAGFYFIYPHGNVDGISSESEMISAYGMHYNWHAVVNPDGLCPQGWRVPATEEVEQLLSWVLSKENEMPGDQLKSCRYVDSPLKGSCATTKHPRWNSFRGMFKYLYYGTDKYGFSALPAGYGSPYGTFLDMGKGAGWWTSTEEHEHFAQNFAVGYSHSDLNIHYDDKRAYYSVRCIKE